MGAKNFAMIFSAMFMSMLMVSITAQAMFTGMPSRICNANFTASCRTIHLESLQRLPQKNSPHIKLEKALANCYLPNGKSIFSLYPAKEHRELLDIGANPLRKPFLYSDDELPKSALIEQYFLNEQHYVSSSLKDMIKNWDEEIKKEQKLAIKLISTDPSHVFSYVAEHVSDGEPLEDVSVMLWNAIIIATHLLAQVDDPCLLRASLEAQINLMRDHDNFLTHAKTVSRRWEISESHCFTNDDFISKYKEDKNYGYKAADMPGDWLVQKQDNLVKNVAKLLASLVRWNPLFFGSNKAEALSYLPENFAVAPFQNFSKRFYEDAKHKVRDAL